MSPRIIFGSALAFSVLYSSVALAQTSWGTMSAPPVDPMGTINNNGNAGPDGMLNGKSQMGNDSSSAQNGTGMGNGSSTPGTNGTGSTGSGQIPSSMGGANSSQ